MNKETNRLDCAIVEDLLPLYCDGIVNEVTSQALESHLKECEECKKEYESLSADIGQEKKGSTKKIFLEMMSRRRRKQILKTIIACIISCTMFAFSWHFLVQLPLRTLTDVTVHEVYKFTSEGKDKFFIIYSSDKFSYCVGGAETLTEGDKTILEFDWKTPVIIKKGERVEYGMSIITAENEETDAFRFCGQTVWTESENVDSEIPAYVYAYDVFENSNADEINDTDTASWSENFDDGFGSDKNYVALHHTKYGTLKWNMKGELISGSPETEKEILDMYR